MLIIDVERLKKDGVIALPITHRVCPCCGRITPGLSIGRVCLSCLLIPAWNRKK